MARSSRVPLLFIAGVCLFLAVIFTVIAGSLLLTEERYRQQGVQAQAIVTAKGLRPATNDTSTVYEISYRFPQPNGAPLDQTEHVTVHQWEAVERGSPIGIEYVAGDPSTARVPPTTAEEATVALIMLGVGLLVGVVGIGMIIVAFRRRVAARGNAVPEILEMPGPSTPSVPPAARLTRDRSTWRIVRSSFGGLFGGIFLVCGVPFLIVGLALFYNDWRFAQEARATEGIVLTKDIRVSSSGRGSNRSRTRHYEATYRFTAEGHTYEGEDELSREDWQRLREREAVQVLYRPGRPASNRLAGGNGWVLKTVFLLLGSIFTAIGGTLFSRAFRSARLESHLRQKGVATEGTIVALDERNVQINDVQQWRLRFAFQDYQGRRHEGTIDLPEPEAREWTVGGTGRVLYDSTHPGNAVWLGRGD